jgi:hypothetical protein
VTQVLQVRLVFCLCSYTLTKLIQAKGVLQDLVVVVSLVRTLTESFGSASDLYHKLKRKSRSDSQSSDDEKGKDDKRRRRSFLRHRDSSPESDNVRGRERRVKWSAAARKEDHNESDEELIVTSSSQVLAEYDRGYRKLGEGYARGDCMYNHLILVNLYLRPRKSGYANSASNPNY